MTRTRTLAVGLMLGACCWLAGPSSADEKKDTKEVADQAFLTKASASTLAEINLSELAVRFARNPTVRQFAQRMIVDHGRANQELTRLANARSVPLAPEMDDNHKKLYEKLTKLSGDDFDRAYVEGMVKDHEQAVKLFEKESKEGKDEALKEWAGKLAPILKRHLERSRELSKSGKGEKKNSKEESDE